jgi:hypothetical protein
MRAVPFLFCLLSARQHGTLRAKFVNGTLRAMSNDARNRPSKDERQYDHDKKKEA